MGIAWGCHGRHLQVVRERFAQLVDVELDARARNVRVQHAADRRHRLPQGGHTESRGVTWGHAGSYGVTWGPTRAGPSPSPVAQRMPQHRPVRIQPSENTFANKAHAYGDHVRPRAPVGGPKVRARA
eukprot:4213969-Prymnesium_polylepis.1